MSEIFLQYERQFNELSKQFSGKMHTAPTASQEDKEDVAEIF
jgi:hypothetical protein